MPPVNSQRQIEGKEHLFQPSCPRERCKQCRAVAFLLYPVQALRGWCFGPEKGEDKDVRVRWGTKYTTPLRCQTLWKGSQLVKSWGKKIWGDFNPTDTLLMCTVAFCLRNYPRWCSSLCYKDMPVDRSGVSAWVPSAMVLVYAMMLLLIFAE